MATLSVVQVNILLLALLLISIASGLCFKQQQRSVVNGVQFNHPFMQSMLMFIGEALCFLWFIGYKKKYREQYAIDAQQAAEKGLKLEIKKAIYAIPTLFDFLSSTVSFFAMNMMPLSIYYMFRGAGIMVTALFSVLFLKRVLYRQNYLGLFLTVAGFVVIGVTAIVLSDSSQDNNQLILGIILIIFSFVFTSSQLVLEEKLFSQYYLNPFEVVGYEGFWGIFITWIALNIFSYIPCPSNMDCPDGMMESVPTFFKTVFTMEGDDQPTLLIMVILSIFIIMLLNGLGLCVTKYASAMSRSLMGVLSPFLVWMITIGLGWDKWKVGQFIGYVVITFGVLIYNEIIVIPIFGFNVNLKKNILKRKEELEAIQKEQELEKRDSENKNLASDNAV
ncbi:hypothetical protein ABPG72_005018 [Tetrahymena utriculariae]